MPAHGEATDARVLDCPLRDEPYAITSPLMDILLNPEAVAIVNRHMSGVLDQLPSQFASKEAPSFSAIITLETIVAMAGLDKKVLGDIDAELSRLPVTDADRAARCARYDADEPVITMPEGHPRILVFEKMTGFRDGPSVAAASAALRDIAARKGWALVFTDKGGAISPAVLDQFDAVVWNNISGDVLTLSQRRAFIDYIEQGGGYVGIHGSGGDPNYFWDWYADTLLGARFIGHPMGPQFQDARINMKQTDTGIETGLPQAWVLNDEWYSFRPGPRETGSIVIATLDETSYTPVGRGGQDLRMGDHPIAWARKIGNGRSFYSAIGHRPEVYADASHLKLLAQGIAWAAGAALATSGGKTDSE